MSAVNYLEIEQYRANPVLFSLRGRIGRARYVVYFMAALTCAFMVTCLAGYSMYLLGRFGFMLYQFSITALYFCALPIFLAQLTVRRAHDFNMPGWLALLLLVPVLNLMFWFIPGSRGENNYGAELEAESTAMKVAAVVLPILMIAAFLSADTVLPDQEEQRPPAVSKPSTPLRPYIP